MSHYDDLEFKRQKLREWYPHYNIDRFTPSQIRAIYAKSVKQIQERIQNQFEMKSN